ncbi:MAG: helix-turn-helix transcriptional regulator [bacterium]|nr:helix-turn-helix transcriptional regulator [bacterium]
MGKITKNKFGDKIRELREKQNLSQGDLAKRLNVSTPYISLLERGLRSPSVNILEEIEQSLEGSLKSLLDMKTNEIKQDNKKQKILKLVYFLKDRSTDDIDKLYTIAETVLKYNSK